MKGKARGTLARLEALENRERERAAAVETEKDETTFRAMGRLAPADLAAVHEHLDTKEAGGQRWAVLCRAGEALEGPPLEDPAGEAARRWAEDFEATPDGEPDPAAPVGSAAYFEREAAHADAERLALAGQSWPDGVSLEDLNTAAQWSAAWLRYLAAYALELGEAVKA